MDVNNIEVKDVWNKIQNKENFILIDCREEDEWTTGHINHAFLMPFSILENMTQEILNLASGQQDICIICRSGVRSHKASVFFQSLGLKNQIFNVKGGMLEWLNTGLPVKK